MAIVQFRKATEYTIRMAIAILDGEYTTLDGEYAIPDGEFAILDGDIAVTFHISTPQ